MFRHNHPLFHASVLGALLNARQEAVGPRCRSAFLDDADSFPADIRNTADAFEITADLPGLDASRVSVDVEGSRLTIAIKDAPEEECVGAPTESEGAVWISRQRRPISGKRVFSFSDAPSIDLEQLSAKLHAGVLTVRVPKKKTPSRSVSIDTGTAIQV